MWLVLALPDNFVIDYPPPQKKAYYIINTLVLKVGGNVYSNNIEYYYSKNELVRVRDSALRGAVILSDSEIWESGLHS